MSLWAVFSIVVGVLVFAILRSTYNSDIYSAGIEAIETIPESIVMRLGFSGSPLFVDIGYWILLIISIFLAFSARKRS